MNKQLVFGVIAVVFATALISSLVAGQASAQKRILQACDQDQRSSALTAGGAATILQDRELTPETGAGSPVQASGNNQAACQNTNNGGNAASS